MVSLAHLYQGKGEVSSTTELTIYLSLCLHEDERLAAIGDGGTQYDGVTRAHLILEAYIVDACVERALGTNLITQQHGACLSHHLAEDDARHHGVLGKVALQEKFIATHMVSAYGIVYLITICIGHGFSFYRVDEQHRVAVGEEGLDLFSVH